MATNGIKKILLSKASQKMSKQILKKVKGPVGFALCTLSEVGTIELLNFVYSEIKI
jgi:hypothetical protein